MKLVENMDFFKEIYQPGRLQYEFCVSLRSHQHTNKI